MCWATLHEKLPAYHARIDPMADTERTVPYTPAVVLKKGTCCSPPLVGALPPNGYIPCPDVGAEGAGCGGGAADIYVENPIRGDGTEATPIGLTLSQKEDNSLVIEEDGLYAPPGGGCQPGPGPYVAVWRVDFSKVLGNSGGSAGDMGNLHGASAKDLINDSAGFYSTKMVVDPVMLPADPAAAWMTKFGVAGDPDCGTLLSPPTGYAEASAATIYAVEAVGYSFIDMSQNNPMFGVNPTTPSPQVTDSLFSIRVGVSLTGQEGRQSSYIVQKWFPCGGSGIVARVPALSPAIPKAV